MPEKYSVIPVRGHYEIYIDGRFYCTTDDLNEAAKEIEDYEMAHALVS